MSSSRKGTKEKVSEMRAADDDGEEEEQQDEDDAAAASMRAATPRRRQQKTPPSQQATLSRRTTRKRRAASSPTNNGGVESSNSSVTSGADNYKNSKPVATKKRRRQAAVDEEETNDADMKETDTAASDDDDDDEPIKKKSAVAKAKDSENHDDVKMQEESSVASGAVDEDKMPQEQDDNEEEEEEEGQKMPAAADGKVNGHHHHHAAAADTAAASSSTVAATVSFAATLPAATNHSTTTTSSSSIMNLRLPHQHTPGKPLHETEIIRQPPPRTPAAAARAAANANAAASLQQQQKQKQPAATGTSMRLHLEAAVVNSPFTIPTPQPPLRLRPDDAEDQNYGGMENGTTTAAAAGGGSGDARWHGSPTASAPLQQQQHEPQHPPQQQQQQAKASLGGNLLRSTVVWCFLILLIQVACGSFWIHPFLPTIVASSRGLIVLYKQVAWCGGQRLLSQERLSALVGVKIMPPIADTFVAISDHDRDGNEQAVVIASTEDDDDAELDKELEKELAEEEQDHDAEVVGQDEQHVDDVENSWLLELEAEDANLHGSDSENFEIALPDEEPDDFGIPDDGDDGKLDIALKDDDDDDGEEGVDDDVAFKALLEAELQKYEEEAVEEDDNDDKIYNMTEKVNLMKKQLDDLEERRKVVMDERRKTRRDLESTKKALQAEKDVFTHASSEVDGALDRIIEEGSNASDALSNKLADMNILLEKLSKTVNAEQVIGSDELDACLAHMGKEYEGLLIDVSTLELWKVVDDVENVEVACSSEEFAVFGRDQALKQIQEFQDAIANESHDLLNDQTVRKSVEDLVAAYASTQPMPRRKKSRPIDSPAKSGSRAHNGPTVNAIKHMIAARLEFERADQTGRVDYAALYNGASVIRTGERATAPSLVDSLPIVNRLAAALRLRFYGHGPEAALTPTHPTTALGQCWAFGPDPRGDQFSSFASFSIRLAKPIFVERISVEHPSSLQVLYKIRTAIRSFRVLGFEDDEARGTAWRLGSYTYEIVDDDSGNRARLRQEYEIPNHVNGVDIPPLRSISLAIDSNWGMPYSCLYRVRVHGSER